MHKYEMGLGTRIAVGVAASTMGALSLNATEVSAHTSQIHLASECSDGTTPGSKVEIIVDKFGFEDQIGGTQSLWVNGDVYAGIYEQPITAENAAINIGIQENPGTYEVYFKWSGGEEKKELTVAECPDSNTTTTAQTTTTTEKTETTLGSTTTTEAATTTSSATTEVSTSTTSAATSTTVLQTSTTTATTLAPAQRIPSSSAAPSSSTPRSTTPVTTPNTLPRTGKNQEKTSKLAGGFALAGLALIALTRRRPKARA